MPGIEPRDDSVLKARRSSLLFLLLGILVLFALRLFHLQVIRHEYYEKLALSNRIQRERIMAPRGFIRDREGAKLVVNVPVYQIDILPAKVRMFVERLELACDWLGIDVERLKTNLDAWVERYPDGREMTVVQAADKRQISILRENCELFPFFKLVMKHRRHYPEGSLAAHVLGYVGEVTDEDIRRSGKLNPGDQIGRSGVEFAYNEYLVGSDGVKVVEINVDGVRVGEVDVILEERTAVEFLGSRPSEPGNDVYLTIDLGLQRSVERIFAWNKGSVIVMNPANGEILAAVSRPVYDPNIFLYGMSEEQWKELDEDPDKLLFNRIVQATYPPGSVFKIVTAYAALSNGVITTGTRLKPCSGSYRFGNRRFGCWKPAGHGALACRGAIEQSCDVFFYQLGEMLTADMFASAGGLFGLGAKTGIDLPSEASGILPDNDYYNRRFGKGKWTKGLLLNYSIGQGEILTTPIQICAMTMVFANCGKKVTPHLVRKILSPEGRVLYTGDVRVDVVRRLDRKILEFIGTAMEDVVSGDTGTGRAAGLPGLRIAGKTGTVQNPHGEDHALFVAFAPVDDPEVVLAIVMENAGHGGAMAAPVARKILSAYFFPVAGARPE